MEKIPLQDVRNIGIIAHIDAGKTTTTERILFYTGVIHRMGNIDDGNTTMDWMEQEQERGITITAASTACTWKNKRINIIDTPGHVDFTIEVERSLKVLDGAVVVLCACSGVQPQTETVWRQADRYNVPRLCFINKIDRLGASFDRVIGEIHERLGANAAAINFPVGAEDAFKAIVDIIEEEYITYKDEQGLEMERSPVPAELQDQLKAYKRKLIERLADVDDAIAEKFLEDQPINAEELHAGIRRAVIKSAFLPVLGGTSLRNRGVQLVLDAVTYYLPSPLDLPPVVGIDPNTHEKVIRKASESDPFSALIFKIATDPYVGKLFYTRVYSGKLTSGSEVYNSSAEKRERVSKIVVMHANKQEIITEVTAGEIVAFVGLKESKSGQTLCDPEKKIVLESMKVPEPVVSMSIEPKTKADQDKLGLTLRKFLDEDPSLRVAYDHETSQTIISGMGELHLEIIVDRMKREFNLHTNVGRPEVAYKETITQKVLNIEGKYISQTGGRGQYGHVVINVEPAAEKGKGVEFVDKTRGGSIPREFIPAVEKGIIAGSLTGVLAAYPTTDYVVTLVDGSYHDVDSNEMAFQLAAKIALKEGLQRGKPVLLEPIMDIEVSAPEEYMGTVLGDLTQRRAKIVGTGSRANLKVSRCEVPLAEMFNYVNALRSLTQGRATFSMEPAFYAEVPKFVAEKIIGARSEASGARKH
jgi:elongation factor G